MLTGIKPDRFLTQPGQTCRSAMRTTGVDNPGHVIRTRYGANRESAQEIITLIGNCRLFGARPADTGLLAGPFVPVRNTVGRSRQNLEAPPIRRKSGSLRFTRRLVGYDNGVRFRPMLHLKSLFFQKHHLMTKSSLMSQGISVGFTEGLCSRINLARRTNAKIFGRSIGLQTVTSLSE